jgi:hypothetical protein
MRFVDTETLRHWLAKKEKLPLMSNIEEAFS